MYLTNRQRVHLLLGYLVRKPTNILRYIRDSYFGQSPLDQGLPWWSFESIDWVKQNLSQSSRVFEWGSGGSTLFLSKYSEEVISIENNEKWLRETKKKLDLNKIKNVSLLKKSLNLSSENHFRECNYFKALSNHFDLIVIDGEDAFGPDTVWSSRETCFDRAEKWINPKGFILVDDSWRYPKISKASKAKKIMRFQSIGPYRKGITSTDIHFY